MLCGVVVVQVFKTARRLWLLLAATITLSSKLNNHCCIQLYVFGEDGSVNSLWNWVQAQAIAFRVWWCETALVCQSTLAYCTRTNAIGLK